MRLQPFREVQAAKWRISKVSVVRSPSPACSNAAIAAARPLLPMKVGRLRRTLLAAIARKSATSRTRDG